MKNPIQINRRDFLKSSAIFSGGLLISITLPGCDKRSGNALTATTFAPNAFLRIGTDDSIRIILSKVEMGQGIWTTLPMLIAEELDCDWTRIKVEHSPALKEYTHTSMPLQATVGSSSTTSEFDRYRQAGATARAMLVEAAAKILEVSPTSCHTENGYVITGDKRISYGEVATDASKLPIPTAKLKEPKDWKYIGKSQKRLDSPDKVNGKAMFGMDIQFPGLLTALVAHAPVFGGKVKSFNDIQSKAITGVRDIVQIPSGVAVIADTYWAAKLGRDALQIEWDLGVNQSMNSKQQVEEYRTLSKTTGKSAQQKGDVVTALKKAVKTIDAEFVLPYLAHATMEPLNCTVKISSDKCEIWTGTQLPSLDQAAVAKILNLKPEQVEINTPFLGGGFGRRGNFDSDWIVEAVHIAKLSGKFIKLVWSREDDMQGGYYRPLYLHHAHIGIDAHGFAMVWQHRVVGQSVFSSPAFGGDQELDGSSVEGVKGSPYLESIPDHSVELHTTKNGVPVTPWRSVGKSHTCFVMESLIDEIAVIAGIDPVDYRRTLLKNHPRHLAALNLVAEKAGWSTPLPKERFRGVALSEGNGSYVAQIAEVSIDNQKLRVHRVVCAIDCGLAVNPDGVVAQMESSIVFGLTAALYGEITLENGQVKQNNFHNYKMLRMSEMPLLEVHIVPSSDQMGGAGEPAVPAIAPAIANALFAATGKRIRNLPIRSEDLIKS
jgi:isoquinoline 1-oxidoreductase beta subunit